MLMEAELARAKGLTPLGLFRGFATAGCEPEEMASGRPLPYRVCSPATGFTGTTSTCGS